MIWDEVEATPEGRQHLGPDLKKTLSIINQSLKTGFNMEIRSISLSLKEDEASGSSERAPTIYHTIVNCEPDHTNSSLTKTPHDLAFIRLILERLIESCSDHGCESEEDEDQEEQTTSSAGKRHRRGNSSHRKAMIGCDGSMSRMSLINLRTELSGPHKDKLSINQVENIIENLESEGWLFPATSRRGPETPEGRQVRRKNSSGNSDGGSGTTWLQLGPRTYMELPDFLSEIGLNKSRLPQLILYG